MNKKPESFSVTWRNHGHWDIANSKARLFRVRGFDGDYLVIDERDYPWERPNMEFNTMGMCMAYICDELMYEHLTVEGQETTVIDINGNRV